MSIASTSMVSDMFVRIYAGDMLFLPLQVLLIITIWRATPIFNAFRDHGFMFYGSLERYLITISNTLMLIMDLALLPFTIVLFLSVYRSIPVYRLFCTKDELYNLGWRKSVQRNFHVITHFICMILDIVFLPWTLLLLVSVYRACNCAIIFTICGLWTNTAWAGESGGLTRCREKQYK